MSQNCMKPDDWENIKYMHFLTESWGDAYKIDRDLVYTIERMRIYAQKPCILTSPAYTTIGHSPNSFHYKGLAADLRFKGASLLEMYILAERFNFSGIGLYPISGRGPFMHLDKRPHDPLNVQARWIAIPWTEEEKETCSANGHWNYLAMNEQNIRNHVI